MSHVEASAGIGEHFKDVIFGAFAIVCGFKKISFCPAGLPFMLDFLKRIKTIVLHGLLLKNSMKTPETFIQIE
jgi:hypothetical protein